MLTQFLAITFYVLTFFCGQTDVLHKATFHNAISAKVSNSGSLKKHLVQSPVLHDSLEVEIDEGGSTLLGYVKGQTTFFSGQHWGLSFASVKASGKSTFQLSPLQLIEIFLI